MKKIFLFSVCMLPTMCALAQKIPAEYFELIKKADSLYDAKDYSNSALTFSSAFKANHWKGYPEDRYRAAGAWALANQADSAFYQLERIISKVNFSDYNMLKNDSDFVSLYKDRRWEPTLQAVKINYEKFESHYNRPVISQLDSIYEDDQKYRILSDELVKKSGPDSRQVKDLWQTIGEKDSINLIKVSAILDKYGWLGPEEVGVKGNTTLFLVIQHSGLSTQEKYLPMMRHAVKTGKAQGHSLALLEDRVALRQGKKQIYGSQIGIDRNTQSNYVMALEDPDNVDKRREEVGLEPLGKYLKYFGLEWDVEQYKKDLPTIELLDKIKNK
jgi:hypothetical protein